MRSSSSKALHKRKARSPTPSENSDIDSDKSTTNGGDSERSLPLLKTRLLTLKKSYKARSSMLKSLKNDTLSRMKIQSSSSLAQAAQRESNHGYKKRRIASEQSGPSSSHSATVSSRRAVSAETISLSGPKKTNVFNGQVRQFQIKLHLFNQLRLNIYLGTAWFTCQRYCYCLVADHL